MKKTRKINMIPEFLRNRKTYMLTALVFTIIGVLSLSFAFFQFADDTDLTSSNTIMVETMNISDITKTFTVTYEGNNGLIKTGILNAGFSDIYKFKVTNNYNGSYSIGINWDLVRSTVTQTNTNYTLYTCTQANYTSATIDNVASLCTAISPNTDNYLPKTNEMHKLTSANEITLGANETQYYIAKIIINNTESGKSFNGAIRVKHRETHTLTLNLDGGDITCDTVADMKTGDTVVLPIPSKTGYVFEGWSIGEVDSVINHYTFTMGSMDTTLTASWTANVQTFLYSGNVQIFTVPQTGTYKVEAWGAGGGYGYNYGLISTSGKGAYTSGEIYLEKNTKLYIYVGGRGENSGNSVGGRGGYNGGGNGTGGGGADGAAGGGGGGATDIRFFSNDPSADDLAWNSSTGFSSRIMVAGGGGGSERTPGGGGGGLIGYSGSNIGGTQTNGYVFGIGMSAIGSYSAGSGSGYYGGTMSFSTDGGNSGSGGSSYISGHIGCNSKNIAQVHTGSSVHYSKKYFSNTIMIDGAGFEWSNSKGALRIMPNPNGENFISGNGNPNNGAVIISFLNYVESSTTELENTITNLIADAFYSFTGTYQVFVVPKDGTYIVEAWGAGGGYGYNYGLITSSGKGGYTRGKIYLQTNDILYIYVGGRGGNSSNSVGGRGGYNGGGNGTGGGDNDGAAGGGGGGATDIRFFSNDPSGDDLAWNSLNGINSRIMVAGGGGGSERTPGGSGGGLVGYKGLNYGGTQTYGYAMGLGMSAIGLYSAGAGSGYYGGTMSFSTDGGNSGSGGSSYISGHTGCNSKNEDGVHTGSPLNINQKYFTDTKMIDGNGYAWSTIKTSQSLMPSPDGSTFPLGNGNSDNGFVKISFFSANSKTQTDINEELRNMNLAYNFSYTNNYQKLDILYSGTYLIELWGAQGNNGTASNGANNPGEGSYVSGEIQLTTGENYYIYVGGQNGYNGGGAGGATSAGTPANGGGATDIRYFTIAPLQNDLMETSNVGLNARIMVAAGGGGSGENSSTYPGGNGGGLKGLSGASNAILDTVTQTAGGSFGLGIGSTNFGGGGGGGYYGGTMSSSYAGGNSGSSYISGHTGCVAINDLNEISIIRTPLSGCITGTSNELCSIHKSTKKFENTLMIDGSGYAWDTSRTITTNIPQPYGGLYGNNVGNVGNGFARITFKS